MVPIDIVRGVVLVLVDMGGPGGVGSVEGKVFILSGGRGAGPRPSPMGSAGWDGGTRSVDTIDIMKKNIYTFCFCFAVVSVAGLDSRGLLDDRGTIREVAERVCGWNCVSQMLGGGGTHPFITLDHILGVPC
jgi:hypothetical protein